MKRCLTDVELASIIDHGPAHHIEAFSAHLDRCANCRALLAAIVREPCPASVSTQSVLSGPLQSLFFSSDDRYQVLGVLGRGGMGVVYEVYDVVRDEVVALKTLPSVSPGAFARLKREFRLVAQLQGSRFVRLHDLVVREQVGFFTMEKVVGQRLDRVIDRTRDTVHSRLRQWCTELGLSIFELHRHRVLHLDIKPSNVMVTEGARVKLLDFGLSIGEFDSRTGSVAGTPSFMAPEQRRRGAVSTATDWYSFGACLFYGLVGAPPPLLASPGALAEALSESSFVYPDLARLCQSLLAPSPRDRPTGWQVLHALGASDAEVSQLTPRRRFVGRREELERVRAAIESREALVVTGTPGIGKTQLIRHSLSPQPIRSLCTLESRCGYNERVPFNALDGIVDSLARFLASCPLAGAELMPLSTLGTMFPASDLVESEGSFASPPSIPKWMRRRAFDELSRILNYIASEHELVVFVDDIQWADTESIEGLAHLLSNPSRKWAFLATSRLDENGSSLAPAEIGPHQEYSLGPLAAADCVALLPHLNHSERQRLRDDTGGHPLFLQVLATMSGRSNRGRDLAGLFVTMVHDLTPARRRVLSVVVLSRVTLTVDLIADVLGMATPAVWRAVEHLADAALLRLEPPAGRLRVEPFHAAVREVAGSMIPAEVRPQLHHGLALSLFHEKEIPGAPFASADHANDAFAAGVRSDGDAFVRAQETAAKLALRASAFETATHYASAGRTWLLHASPSKSLAHDLTWIEIEACSLGGDIDRAARLFTKTVSKLSVEDRIRFDCQRIRLALLVEDADRALEYGAAALQAAGLTRSIPVSRMALATLLARVAARTMVTSRKARDTRRCDTTVHGRMQLLVALLPVAVFKGDDRLSAWLALLSFHETLRYGYSSESLLGIAGKGGAAAMFGAYRSVAESYRRAQSVITEFESVPPVLEIGLAGWLAPWCEPFRESARSLIRLEQSLERSGDVYNLALARTIRLTAALEAGDALHDLETLPRSVIEAVNKANLGFEELLGFSRLSIATLRRLRFGPSMPAAPALHNRFASFITHLHEGVVQIHWGCMKPGLEALNAARSDASAARGQPLIARLYVFFAIAIAGDRERCERSVDGGKRSHRELLDAGRGVIGLTRMARACPANYAAPTSLAWAELARAVRLPYPVVRDLYRRAVALAEQTSHLEMEAMARSRALLLEARSGRQVGRADVDAMSAAYERWGSPGCGRQWANHLLRHHHRSGGQKQESRYPGTDGP